MPYCHSALRALPLALALLLLTPAVSAGDTVVDGPATVVPNQDVEGYVKNQFRAARIDGDWMAVRSTSVFANQNQLFVYERVAGDWTLRQRLTVPTAVVGFDLEGSRLVVSSTGQLATWTLVGGVWQLTQVLPDTAFGGSTFGRMSLCGDTLALEQSSSETHVLVTDANGDWTLQQTLTTPSAPRGLGLSGDSLIVLYSTGSEVFERTGTVWSATGPVVGLGTGNWQSIHVDGDLALVVDQTPTFATPVRALQRLAGTWTLIQAQANDFRHVALSGDVMASTKNGFARVHRFNGTQWSLSQVLPVSNASSLFASVDGSTMATSSSLDAQIFEETKSGAYQPKQVLVPSQYVPGGEFGQTLDRDGDRILVGAPEGAVDTSGTPAPGAGVAVVYERSGGSWSKTAILSPPDGAGGDEFGATVAIDGDHAIVGAPLHSNPPGSGAAYAYRFQGGAWTFVQELNEFGGLVGLEFGGALELEGDTLVVGAPSLGGVGAVFTYEYDAGSGSWLARTALDAPAGFVGDRFGFALALDGPKLLVSQRGQSIHLYDELPSGWVLDTSIDGPNGIGSLQTWGNSVDLDGGRIAVGAPFSSPANLSGSVTTYDRQPDGSWLSGPILFNQAPFSQEHLGFGVQLEGDLLVAGFESDFEGQIVPQLGAGFVIYQRQGPDWIRASLYGETGDEYYNERWVVLDGSEVALGWNESPTAAGEVRIWSLDHQPSSYCFGDGSAIPCPCGNAGAPGAGCANSATAGAVLSSSGSTSLAAADLVVHATALPPNKTGLVFAGSVPLALPFGDGLLCLSPQFRGPIRFSGASGSIDQPDLDELLMAAPGDTWQAQCWYRDPAGACGAGTNTSSALVLTFTP